MAAAVLWLTKLDCGDSAGLANRAVTVLAPRVARQKCHGRPDNPQKKFQAHFE
jgi:hypothetical protein